MEIKSKRINKHEITHALKIYNHFIRNSLSNFEENPLSAKEFNEIIKNIKKNNLPFLIAKDENKVIGVAFVNKFRGKSGYRFTFEHSIYVDPHFINYGYGTIILKELIKECRNNKKIKNLIAVIGGDNNISSIKIHKKNGFKYIGSLKKVGRKKNKWIDSIYMQKIL